MKRRTRVLHWLAILVPGPGFAQFSASDVQLMSLVRPDDFEPAQTWGATHGAAWGYTSATGREYAIVATARGTGFVEVTDPGRPRIVGVIDGVESGFRNGKSFRDHVYVVNEGGGGIQVVDVSQIDAGVIQLVNTVASYPDIAHNLALDETSGFLYQIGFWNFPGMVFHDLSDPVNPAVVGSWSGEQVHDAQVVTYESGPYQGRQVVFACTNDAQDSLSLIDVTDKSIPLLLSKVHYPNAALSHQVWLSEDRKWAFLNDEGDVLLGVPSTIYVFDVQDIYSPMYVTSFTNGNSAATKECFVKGDLLLAANHTSGLRIFDVADPLAATEIGWFDTWPCTDAPTTNSLHSLYPFFDSGVVVGVSHEDGLFVWTLGEPSLRFEFPSGIPELLPPSGGVMRVRILEQSHGELQAGSAALTYDVGAGEQTTPLVPLGGKNFLAVLPDLPCGSLLRFHVSARSENGFTWTDPPAASTTMQRHDATIATSRVVAFHDDFETHTGWSTGALAGPGDRASWERVDPNGTPEAPEDDHTPGAATHCYVTVNGPPGICRKTQNEVEGGPYYLASPVLDLSAMSDPIVRYSRWFDNDGGDVRDDVLAVEVTADGLSWVVADVIGPDGPERSGTWILDQFRLLDFVSPTHRVQVRFVVGDEPNDSSVEAAIDDFEVFEALCDG